MDLREMKHSGDGFNDSVLRTFAVLVGVALLLVGLGVLASVLFLNGAARVFSVTSVMVGSLTALAVGVLLTYWGVKWPRSNVTAAEESLSKLVQQYEREGKTKELEDAREQLIQLLIEKDEQNLKDRT